MTDFHVSGWKIKKRLTNSLQDIGKINNPWLQYCILYWNKCRIRSLIIYYMKKTILSLTLFLALGFAASRVEAQISVGISVHVAPPAIPVYEQPPCPTDGYLWVPGYWAWDDDAAQYYWVPGYWSAPPSVGLLWTPGYWGWGGGAYAWHAGYWGPHVGFYGGGNYGFGFGGGGVFGGGGGGRRVGATNAAQAADNKRAHN